MRWRKRPDDRVRYAGYTGACADAKPANTSSAEKEICRHGKAPVQMM
jgi:hypothetical protein